MRRYTFWLFLTLNSLAAHAYAESSQEQFLAQTSAPAPGGGAESEVQSSPVNNSPTLPVAPGAAGVPGAPGAPGAPGPAAPFKPSGFVEGGGDYNYVTHNYGNWVGEYVKGEIQTDPNNRWNSEILNQEEFNSTGVYGNIGNTHTFNEDWFSSVTVGLGDGGLYLPRYRVDAFLNRKWLEDRQLITTFGIGADHAMDSHSDESLFLGATYYFKAPWVIQGGVRVNDSNPGNIYSTSQFVAVTQGEDKKHLVTLRYGFGHEAYQIIGPGQTLDDFPSEQVSLEWRQWVGKDWGFNLRGEQYHNPTYDRTGINLGFFKEF